ncbi:hypothetical protein PC118_g18232 [Phytophthora cactorum]|uniref:Uncharacterized protein n=1 Tax=Phytophthora cactorum TaxID=29920 RepID=A0A8T1F4H6_9STRA|nr:hypothetical protein PC112_g18554 [Phytophthora cactorum]KAG2968083.1 hypothetical protein PC118_g18232 [Phytophthora cactorum]
MLKEVATESGDADVTICAVGGNTVLHVTNNYFYNNSDHNFDPIDEFYTVVKGADDNATCVVNSNAELSQNEAAATTNEASAATTLLLEAAAESESLGSNAKALVLKREDCELLQDVDASSETETASAGEANDVTVNTYASHGSEIAATDNSMALIASIKTSASSTNTKLPVLVQRPALLPLLAAQQRLTPLLPTPHQRQRLVPP